MLVISFQVGEKYCALMRLAGCEVSAVEQVNGIADL